jgi:methionine aminopeptidase
MDERGCELVDNICTHDVSEYHAHTIRDGW